MMKVDVAILIIDGKRAELGAIQNRFKSTSEILAIFLECYGGKKLYSRDGFCRRNGRINPLADYSTSQCQRNRISQSTITGSLTANTGLIIETLLKNKH